MAFKNKSMTIGAAIFCLGTLVPAVTGAYAISPMEIYRQARQQNEVFLQKLSPVSYTHLTLPTTVLV